MEIIFMEIIWKSFYGNHFMKRSRAGSGSRWRSQRVRLLPVFLWVETSLVETTSRRAPKKQYGFIYLIHHIAPHYFCVDGSTTLLHIFFHMLVPYFRIGEQKRSFCEAVNWSRSDQEGMFLFAMLAPSDGNHLMVMESSRLGKSLKRSFNERDSIAGFCG